MKQTAKYAIAISLVMFTLMACEQMNDYHFDYIKDGEIVYTTKVDSVETFAGNERVKIMGILREPFGVEYIKIYFNDRNDSVITDYVQQSELDTVSIILTDLPEKSYGFEIYTADHEGNRSVKVSSFGTAYGELYQSGLISRAIDSDSARGSDVYINWLPSDEMERGAEVKYMNKSGSEIVMEITEDSSSIVLTDFDEGMTFRSFFVPEETALDTFPSDWATINLLVCASTGVFTHPLLGPRDFTLDKVLRELSPGSYETDFADVGESLGYRMKLKVDEANNVEVISIGSTPAVVPNGENSFDPGTGTFILNYKYDHLTGERLIAETLVKK